MRIVVAIIVAACRDARDGDERLRAGDCPVRLRQSCCTVLNVDPGLGDDPGRVDGVLRRLAPDCALTGLTAIGRHAPWSNGT